MDHKIRTTRIKIHDDGNVRTLDAPAQNNLIFSEQQYDLVICVRFLERNFMNTLKKMVKPGGFILYLAFTAGVEVFEHPKDPKSILKSNELFETFCEDPIHKFKNVVNRVDKLPDGRPVQAFVAQKCI